MDLAQLYQDHEAMLYYHAHKMSERTGLHFTDFVGECHEAFMKATESWQPEKSKFSTWLSWQLRRVNFDRIGPVMEYDNSYDAVLAVTPERECYFWEVICGMTEDARSIVSMALEGPWILLERGSLGVLKNQLRDLGWDWLRIEDALREVRYNLRSMDTVRNH